jgi:hypothetical protein
MSENEHGEWPDGSFAHHAPLKPIYVPIEKMGDHPLLRRALAIGADAGAPLEWPGLNQGQKRAVSAIRLVDYGSGVQVSIPPRINLDVFITEDTDEEAPPSWKARANDVQRYYTQATDTGFHIVGTFTAITIDEVRRYFSWADDHWDEIGQAMFLYYRDHDDTHFMETDAATIEQISSQALELTPTRTVDADADDEEDEDEDDMLMTEVDAMVQHGIAVGIATIAHRGQLDKLGYDYIDHPARVAENFDWLNEPVEHCTAWLHDVIEDTDISASDLLKAGMLPEIVAAVDLLTRRADVADADYYERIRQHPVALAVKLADIDDNSAEWRTRKLDYDTQVRLSNKYYQARQLLQPTPGETENS